MSGSPSDLMGYYLLEKKIKQFDRLLFIRKKKKNPAVDGLQFIRKKNLAIMKLLEHIQYTKSPNFS